MTIFSVWAPKAGQMTLFLEDHHIPMGPGENGWWSVDAWQAAPGSDYGFLIDGEGPFPDPRSRSQPSGVHGLSRVFDSKKFVWTDAGFQPVPMAAAVIYELHIGTFTSQGTFDSAVDKLNYLASLGVTHVELMPVNEFSGEHGWGYDGVDLFAAEHAYGGPEALQRLVNACHAHGMAVILDVVYNHLGPEGNYLDRFGPYHSDHHHTAWGAAVNFDGPGSDEVRCFFINNALMWLDDFHIDGLRLDAVHAILDNSAIHFLEALAARVRRLETDLGRRLVLIAESDLNDPRIVRPPALGGYGFDAQWSDDFHHALHVLLTGEQNGYYAGFEPWHSLEKSLTRVFVYDGIYSDLRERQHGRPVAGVPVDHFLGYLQTHDQVGNRAKGDRISHLVNPALTKIGAALALTAPFVPMLFQGEEWGASTPFQYFSDHQDPGLGRAVSEGRRNEFASFGWLPEDVPDPQDPETFHNSKLDWSELDRETHAGVLAWYRSLIALRKEYAADLCSSQMVNGRIPGVGFSYNRSESWLVVTRGRVKVACNLSRKEQRLEWIFEDGARLLLSSDPQAGFVSDGLVLPPESVLIFESRMV